VHSTGDVGSWAGFGESAAGAGTAVGTGFRELGAAIAHVAIMTHAERASGIRIRYGRFRFM
jgi:hypothetical protein